MEREYNVGTWLTPSDEYIKDIKQTLVEKGVATELTPNSELSENLKNAIESIDPNNIRGNTEVLGVKGKLINDWEDVDVDNTTKYLAKPFDYIYHHSNGVDHYGSYNNSDSIYQGIWHWDSITGQKTRIYKKGYYINKYFEDSQGNVYASASYTGGVIHLKGTTATQISTKTSTIYYEDPQKNVYLSGNGFYKLVGSTIEQLIRSGTWVSFVKLSNNTVYAFGENVSSSVLMIDNGNVKVIYEKFDGRFFYVTKNNTVYVGSTSANGILCINNDTATLVYPTGRDWNLFFESTDGKVYIASTYSGTKGILQVEDKTATLIYDVGYNWKYIIEDNKGNIYTCTDYNNGAVGIYLIRNSTVKQIHSASTTWHFFKSSLGNIYCGSMKSEGYGILLLDGETVTEIATSSYMPKATGWVFFFEAPNGKILATTSSTATNGVFLIDNNNKVSQIYKLGANGIQKYWQYFNIYKDGVIISQSPKPDGSDFLYFDKDNNIYLVKGGNQ